MSTRSSIDIGSNTVLLLIGEVVDGRIKEIVHKERVTALGRDLDRTRRFHPQSMEDTLDALWDYCDIMEKYGLNPGEALVSATEAARVATNSESFFQEVGKNLGLRIRVITAEGEAYYTFLGVVQNNSDAAVIMDVGGASTELIKVFEGSLKKSVSLPVGSVRGSDWEREGCFEKRLEDILADESFCGESFQTERLIGVGGTITALAAVCKGMRNFDAGEIEGCSIHQGDLRDCVARIDGQSEDELFRQFPFLGKRVKSIKAGGRLALRAGEIMGVRTWIISTRGLRHGVLAEGHIDGRFMA